MKTSCLNEELVKNLVWDNYGINVDRAERIGSGVMSNRYKISSGSDVYFLKEFLSRMSKEKINEEALLLKFLKSEAIPVAEFLKTNNDKYCFKHTDRYICMQEFIAGEYYEKNTFPDEFMLLAGEMLGKMDKCLKDYKLRDRKKMMLKHCRTYKVRKGVKELKSLSNKISKLDISEGKFKKINKRIEYLIKLQPRVKKYGKKFKNITYSSSHGDYRCPNLMCGENEINAVIDFSSSGRLPIAWNIIRFYTLSAPECKNADDIDISKLIAVVKKYLEYAPLTYEDLKFMPYIYLHILARHSVPEIFKKYIKQKLMNNKKAAERLLKRAFWYIELCCYLEENSEEISKRLCEVKHV